MGEVARRGLEPRIVVLGLHHEGHEGFAGLRVLRVLEGQEREQELQFLRLADGADRPRRVVHVLHDRRHVLRLGRGVDRDAVGRERQFAGEERLVVRRVVPRRRAGDEGLIELLGVFQRLGGLGRVDDDLLVLVDQVRAVRPQEPVHPAVAVTRRMTEGEAAGGVVLLEGAHQLQEAGGVAGDGLEARLLHHGDAVVDVAAVERDRDRDPLALALARGLGRRHPAAVLLAEVVGDVAHFHALLGEEMRQGVEAPHHVRALPGVGGDGGLGLDVVERLAGDVDLHAGGLREGLDHAVELRVLGLHEAAPAQDADGGVGLGLEGRLLRPGLGEIEKPGCAHGAERGAALDHGTTVEIHHRGFLPLLRHSRPRRRGRLSRRADVRPRPDVG